MNYKINIKCDIKNANEELISKIVLGRRGANPVI